MEPISLDDVDKPVARPPVVVPIREIGPRHRTAILNHLLALEPGDRYLRFGYAASDRQIANYVDSLKFERDELFGIFNRKLELIALAHLAFPPDFAQQGYAEFGVSVDHRARGRGYGSRLFERAAIHAVNDGLKTLYIHALTENRAMLGIARRAGAKVVTSGSESEAYLSLPVATLESRLHELLVDQVGHIDYRIKAQRKRWRALLAGMQEVRHGVREGRHTSGS